MCLLCFIFCGSGVSCRLVGLWLENAQGCNQSVSQGCNLIWGSVGEGTTSKIMWLLTAFIFLWLLDSFVDCHLEATLSSLPWRSSQCGFLFPQSQQGKESPSKLVFNLRLSRNWHSITFVMFNRSEASLSSCPHSKGEVMKVWITGDGNHWDLPKVFSPHYGNCKIIYGPVCLDASNSNFVPGILLSL